MCLLVLATVTADARPINGPVDGFFYRGEWYFGSQHRVAAVPAHPGRVLRSAPPTCREEAFSVTTHGRAVEIDAATHDEGGFRQTVLAYYAARFGESASLHRRCPGRRLRAHRSRAHVHLLPRPRDRVAPVVVVKVLDAPSNLGLRPPVEGSVPGCYKAPWALRQAGLMRGVTATEVGV